MDRTEMWVVESVNEIRSRVNNMYANEIGKVVNCSVCHERLEGEAAVCIQGCQVCKKCESETANCALCDSQVIGVRNYLPESVLSKFKEIKITLSDAEENNNETANENKVCVEPQNSDMVQKNANEESPPSPSNQSKISHSDDTAGLSVGGKGKFPCRIGTCTDQMLYHRMIHHIKCLHEEFLIDAGIVQGNEYTNTWKILYQVNNVFDRAIHIYNMGIFFVKIFTTEEGDLRGCVQITNSRVNAKYFHYKMEVGNKNTFVCFEGQVLGSRTASLDNPRNGLSIHNTYVPHLLQRKKSFECILKITLLAHSPLPPKLKNNPKSRKSL